LPLMAYRFDLYPDFSDSFGEACRLIRICPGGHKRAEAPKDPGPVGRLLMDFREVTL
jgi:hypothetical protein